MLNFEAEAEDEVGAKDEVEAEGEVQRKSHRTVGFKVRFIFVVQTVVTVWSVIARESSSVEDIGGHQRPPNVHFFLTICSL